jgi:DNA adenine methylase
MQGGVQAPLVPPFPYFGGKRRVAGEIWARLGDVANYVEPFAGSCAVLLARPHTPHIETINDADGLVANFWRAMALKPEEVLHHADWPVSEPDLVARQNWLTRSRESMAAQLMADPAWCDPQAAGWWVWAISQWIGSQFCKREVAAALPYICGDGGHGIHGAGRDGIAKLAAVAARMRHVRVACGDWSRVVGASVLSYKKVKSIGVVLDPPYDDGANVYAKNERMSADVRAWCMKHQGMSNVRIALCGYDGEHNELADRHGWTVYAYKKHAGYGVQAADGAGDEEEGDGRRNARRERVWFSPSCLQTTDQTSLL